MIYNQIFLAYVEIKSFKLSFHLNCVLKRANDLNDFKLTRFAFDRLQKFEAVPRESKSFPNPLETQQRYNKYLTNLVFSVCTASYGSSLFPLQLMRVYYSLAVGGLSQF